MSVTMGQYEGLNQSEMSVKSIRPEELHWIIRKGLDELVFSGLVAPYSDVRRRVSLK